MTVIYLSKIYKIIYYKYLLSFKVLGIFGVKHSQSFKTMSLKSGTHFFITFQKFFTDMMTKTRKKVNKAEIFEI